MLIVNKNIILQKLEEGWENILAIQQPICYFFTTVMYNPVWLIG